MRSAALAILLSLLAPTGCDQAPGKPSEADRYVRPEQVLDFERLYASNCSGCHGAAGRLGPAQPLNDPLYLAFAPDEVIRRVIHDGVAGTAMPAFGVGAGGALTDAQIDALIAGMRASWSGRPPRNPPAYTPEFGGDWGPGADERGERAFARFCGDCHGDDGRGGEKAGSVVDPAYLGLRSDQGLRTTVVVGRPDLDMPDWRSDVPGRAMSAQQISDVVGWLVARRPEFPGQPYPSNDEGSP